MSFSFSLEDFLKAASRVPASQAELHKVGGIWPCLCWPSRCRRPV